MSCTISLRRNLALTIISIGLIGTGTAHAEADGPTLTGHVDLVSRYILRGVTTTYGNSPQGLGNAGADAPESDRPALQWGLDWNHPSGIYLGYFGSQINYSYQRLGESYSQRGTSEFQSPKSVENDFYGGYNGVVGGIGYTAGLTGYVYVNGKHANALETKLALSYADFTLGAQTLLHDVVWGNKGDTYWTLNYLKPLPYKITLNASLGYFTYKKEGKYLGTTDTLSGRACPAGESFVVNGCFAGAPPSAGGFRHLVIGFTQPIAQTGLTWGLQGIIAGENRFSIKQRNQLLASLSYGF
jgi:uncharacterized protein (TIGR02001 family)